MSNINELTTTKSKIKTALENKGCVVDVGMTGYAEKIRGIRLIDDVNSVVDFKSWMTFEGSAASDVTLYEMFNKVYDAGPYGGRYDFKRLFYGCENLVTPPSLLGKNTVKPRDCSWMFYGCKNLVTAPDMNTSLCCDFARMFSGCSSLTSVPNYTMTCKPSDNDGISVAFMFNGCSSLTSVPQFDFSKMEYINGVFFNCSELTNIGGLNGYGREKNAGVNPTPHHLYGPFYGCKKISRESMLNIFNGLYDRAAAGYFTPTIYFDPEVMARLTDADIAIAVRKGWVIVSN